MRSILLVFAFIAVTCSTHAQGSWASMASMPTAGREGASVFTIVNKAYVFGGFQSASPNYLDDLWEYDPATNTWTQRASLPDTARTETSAFSINGKGYVCGGRTYITTNDYFFDTWEYDPAGNSWAPKADVPYKIYQAVSMEINGLGYLMTGKLNIMSMDYVSEMVFEYDPVGDLWTTKNNFPGTERYYATGFTINGKGYLGTGSFSPSVPLADFWEYDPVSDSWLQKANVPGCARTRATSFTLSGLGFLGAGNCSNEWFLYDPATNGWINQSNFASPNRKSAVGFSLSGYGYVATGTDAVPTNQLWQFQPCLITPPVVTQVGDTLYCSGGYSSYQWKYNGAFLPHATDSQYVAVQSGFYSVYVTNTNGCYITSALHNYQPASTQNVFQHLSYFGTSAGDKGIAAKQTLDGGFLFLNEGSGQGPGSFSIGLVKTDAEGNVLWSKTYGTPSLNAVANSICLTEDGGFMVGGYINSPSINPLIAAILKLDSAGNLQWTAKFNSSEIQYLEQTPDGGSIAVANIISTGTPSLVIKLDSSGQVQWQKTLTPTSVNYVDAYSEIHATSDGGYILVGNHDVINAATDAAVVMKLDASGNIIWNRHYREQTGGVHAQGISICEFPDGGFAILGMDASMFVMKIDAGGNVLFTRQYQNMDPQSIFRSKHSGLIISGVYTLSTYERPALAKLDWNLDLITSQRYTHGNGFTFSFNTLTLGCFHIDEAYDGGFVLSTQHSSSRLYLIKTDNSLSTGCFESSALMYDTDIALTSFNASVNITSATGFSYDSSLLMQSVPWQEDSICNACATPVANFTYNVNNNIVQFTDSLSWGSSYHWDFGDASTSNYVNPVHTYQVAGTYTVCLIVSNSCGTDTICRTITVFSGVGMEEGTGTMPVDINIYPNPSSAGCKIQISSASVYKNLVVELYDIRGRVLVREKFGNSNTAEIRRDGIDNGLYFVSVLSDSAVLASGKIVFVN